MDRFGLCLFLPRIAVFYFRPSRFFPRDNATMSIIDNLAYVMQSMIENEQSLRDGIGLVANFTGWKMANFNMSYWHKLLMTLQGRRVPTRVQIFLIVNPPSWFGSIQAIMRPMMSDAFRKKVHVIQTDQLPKYLSASYHDFLPEDLATGQASTKATVKAFVASRKRIESARILSS